MARAQGSLLLMKSVLQSKSVVMKSLASCGLVEVVKYMNSIRESETATRPSADVTCIIM